MQPKYKSLADKMMKDVLKKPIGTLMPSEADLLLKYKTSRNTLRSALSVIREAGFIESKAGIGTKIVSHAPKKTAQKTVQVILPATGYQFFYQIMDGINSVLGPLQIALQYKNCNNDLELERQYLQEAIYDQYDGLIYMSSFYANEIEFPAELNQFKNIVLVNNSVKGFDGPLVCSKDEKGAYEIVSYMIKSGYKKIIHLAGANCSSHQNRKNGYMRAMSEHNLEVHVYPVGYTFEDGYGFIKSDYQKKNLEGYSVFCANDFSALGCSKGLSEKGVSVPGTVTVAGFGGLQDQMGLYPYKVISAKQDAFVIGQEAAKLVVDHMNAIATDQKNKRIELPVEIINKNLVKKM